MKDCYHVIKSRHITEKATMLAELQSSESNRSVRACGGLKAVFIVDENATKPDIATAIETIYKERNVKVTKVNTICVKPKLTKRGRGKGRKGKKAGFKKAVVTFRAGDAIDNV